MAHPSFTVISLVNEPTQDVKRFVAWYLDQGAAQIILFFDNPEDPSFEVVKGIDRVRAIRMTRQFRARNSLPQHRPPQRKIGLVGYKMAKTDWVLRVDCDELVFAEDQKLDAFLAGVPDKTEYCLIKTAEQVLVDQNSDKTFFRLPMSGMASQKLYQDLAPAFEGKHGLVGHAFGKSFTRGGFDKIILEEHKPRLNVPHLRFVRQEFDATDRIYCLHFNATPFEQWAKRLPWRLENHSFGKLMGKYLGDIVEKYGLESDELKSAYDRLFKLSPAQFDELHRQEFAQAFDLGLEDLLDQYF